MTYRPTITESDVADYAAQTDRFIVTINHTHVFTHIRAADTHGHLTEWVCDLCQVSVTAYDTNINSRSIVNSVEDELISRRHA